MKRVYLSPLLLALAAPLALADAYAVRVDAPEGLSALLYDNLELVSLKDDPAMDDEGLASLMRDTPAAARTLLETAGYFDSAVDVSLEPGSPRTVVVKVKPGAPVVVADVELVLEGEVREQPDFQELRAKLVEDWPLPMGAAFNQDEWAAGKKGLLRVLSRKRYPMARIVDSRARVDPKTGKAELVVKLDSGPVMEFGALRVQGLKRYPERVVTGQADFKEGSDFDQDKLTALQASLERDVHFSAAAVVPQLEQADGRRVPIDVFVTELPRQKGEAGLLYDSADGLGVRLGYEHYNIFKRGFTGSLLASWKKSEQKLALGLGFPRQSDGYSHSANLTVTSKDVQNTETNSIEGGIWRVRSRGNIEARYGFEYVLDDERVGEVETFRNQAVLFTVGWTQRKLDDAMNPRNGYLLDGQASTTLGPVMSETSFVRARARAAGYWSPGFMPGTWVVRGEVGQVWTDDASKVPASRLFRVGGQNSVRGYEFEGLGVAGPNGAVTGGRVMAIASLEYQFDVVRNWRAALFTDQGNAADTWTDFQMARSYGVGVRWISPFAPIAFDVARAEEDRKIRWALSLGLPF